MSVGDGYVSGALSYAAPDVNAPVEGYAPAVAPTDSPPSHETEQMSDTQIEAQRQPMQTFTRETVKPHINNRRYDYVEIPDLGFRARVQSLHTREVSAAEDAGVKVTGGKAKFQLRSVRALICAYGWVDESGARLYNPTNADDIAELGAVDNRITAKVAKAIRELSGMDGSDEEDEEEGK